MRSLARFAEKQVRALVLDVTANLVEDTPRDTSWARTNWLPSIGKAVEVPVNSPESVSFGAQQVGLAAVATSYTLSKGKVFITNNVPYIQRLNDGWSKQAPAGFVQAAILRAVRKAEEFS